MLVLIAVLLGIVITGIYLYVITRKSSTPTTAPPTPRTSTAPPSDRKEKRSCASQLYKSPGATRLSREQIKSDALAVHNHFRKLHGLQPLEWDDELAKHAQNHANTCVYGHTNYEIFKHKNITLPQQFGENLGLGHANVVDISNQWYDEIRDYDYDAGKSRNGANVGHFLQMMWDDVKKVGCAVHTCSDGFFDGTKSKDHWDKRDPNFKLSWACYYDRGRGSDTKTHIRKPLACT